MKKLASLFCLSLCGVILSWCGSSGQIDTSDSLSWSETSPITTTFSLEDCQKSVTDYLDTQKSVTPDTSKTIVAGSNIVTDYIGRLADGSVFDTSVESVAKACNLYTPQRSYTQWLPFAVGAGQMIAWFDKWVVWMHLWETKTITIASADAYGAATVSLPVDQLPSKPDGSSYKKGDKLQTMNGEIEIIDIDSKEFTINNIHPLAGKDLIFDITIKAIN